MKTRPFAEDQAASEGDDVGAREGVPSYVAHSAEDGRLEPLEAHLREVSEMAARFAEPLGMAELAADEMRVRVEIAVASCMNLLGRYRGNLEALPAGWRDPKSCPAIPCLCYMSD